MKKITNNNIKSIYKKLQKFFQNKKKSGFITWHNFDCPGKRISPIIKTPRQGCINVTKEFPAPEIFEFDHKGNYIILSFTAGVDSMTINPGDMIKFKKGQVRLRQRCDIGDYKFIYIVWIQKHLTEESLLRYENEVDLWQSELEYDDFSEDDDYYPEDDDFGFGPDDETDESISEFNAYVRGCCDELYDD